MSGVLELLGVTLALGVVLAGLLIMLRGRQPLRTFRGTTRIREPRRPGIPLMVLGLLAAGDGALIFESIGAPGVIAVVLGIATGVLGSARTFPVFGYFAALAGLYSLFNGTAAQSILAGFVLLPLAIGILLGVFPFGEIRPTALLAKVCTAIVFTRFAIAPFGDAVIGADLPLDAARAVATVVIAWFALPLFLLRGPGVSLLLGIGVGLLDLYYSVRVGAPLSLFTVVFVVAWLVVAGMRMLLGRRR